MNKNLLIGGALIGGGLYFAYKKGLLDKFLNKKPAETPEAAIDTSQATLDNIVKEQKEVVQETKKQAVSQTILNAANTAYKRKVEELQGLLKVGIDGNPGRDSTSKTNKAIAATYGLNKGIVSPLNVQYYIEKAKNKQTLVAQSTEKKKVEKAKDKVVKDAKLFVDFVNNKGLTARLLQNVSANKFQFDKVKGIFIDMKSARRFGRGTKFTKGEFSNQTRGAFVLFKDGAFVFALDPSKFIVN